MRSCEKHLFQCLAHSSCLVNKLLLAFNKKGEAKYWIWTINKIIIFRLREKFSLDNSRICWILVWTTLLHLERVFSQNTLYLLVYQHISYNFTWVREFKNSLNHYPWESLFLSIPVLYSADLTLSWIWKRVRFHWEIVFSQCPGLCVELRIWICFHHDCVSKDTVCGGVICPSERKNRNWSSVIIASFT